MLQVGAPCGCSNCCPEGPVLASWVPKVVASREAMRSGGFSTNVPCDVEGFSIADSEFEPPHAATSIADAIAPKALRNLFMPASPFRPGQKRRSPALSLVLTAAHAVRWEHILRTLQSQGHQCPVISQRGFTK